MGVERAPVRMSAPLLKESVRPKAIPNDSSWKRDTVMNISHRTKIQIRFAKSLPVL